MNSVRNTEFCTRGQFYLTYDGIIMLFGGMNSQSWRHFNHEKWIAFSVIISRWFFTFTGTTADKTEFSQFADSFQISLIRYSLFWSPPRGAQTAALLFIILIQPLLMPWMCFCSVKYGDILKRCFWKMNNPNCLHAVMKRLLSSSNLGKTFFSV